MFSVSPKKMKEQKTEKERNVLDEKNLSFMMEITLYDRNITHSCEILQQITQRQIIDELINWNYFDI